MDETDLEIFRLKARMLLIERLALKTAFAMPVALGACTKEESRRQLIEFLEAPIGEGLERAFGQRYQDPAKTALYSEEVREVVSSMKAYVNGLAQP